MATTMVVTMTTVANRNTMTATHGMGIMAHETTIVEEKMIVTDTKAAPKTNAAVEKAMVTPTMAMAVDLTTAAMIEIGMMTGTMTATGMENQNVLAILMEKTEAEDIRLLLK
jgi:hypothetical protein